MMFSRSEKCGSEALILLRSAANLCCLAFCPCANFSWLFVFAVPRLQVLERQRPSPLEDIRLVFVVPRLKAPLRRSKTDIYMAWYIVTSYFLRCQGSSSPLRRRTGYASPRRCTTKMFLLRCLSSCDRWNACRAVHDTSLIPCLCFAQKCVSPSPISHGATDYLPDIYI